MTTHDRSTLDSGRALSAPWTVHSRLATAVHLIHRRAAHHNEPGRSGAYRALALAALRQSGWQVDAIGGLTPGADPISYAIAYASASSDAPLRAFTVRKEAKAHGTGRLIEGPFREGDRVVVVEDVITTGGSASRGGAFAPGAVSGVLALSTAKRVGVLR